VEKLCRGVLQPEDEGIMHRAKRGGFGGPGVMGKVKFIWTSRREKGALHKNKEKKRRYCDRERGSSEVINR